MRCRHAERLLSDHLEGLLSPREEDALTTHLARCPGCRRRREEVRAVGTDLRTLAAFLPPADVEHRAIEQWFAEHQATQPDPGTRALRLHLPRTPETRWACRIGADRRRLVSLAAAGLVSAAVVGALLVGQSRATRPSKDEVASAPVPSRREVEGLVPRSSLGGEQSPGRPVGAEQMIGLDRTGVHVPLRPRRMNPRAGTAQSPQGSRRINSRAGRAQSPPSRTDPLVREGGLRAVLAAVSTAGPSAARAAHLAGVRQPAVTSNVPRHQRDDLVYLNAAPATGHRRGRNIPADDRSTPDIRPGTSVPVRDDFVTVPLPRIAAGGPAADRAAAEAAAAYQHEVAVVDARLSRNVTLAFKATAFSDLCDHLRADTGIALAAGPSIADEKVTIFAEKLPLREVMRQLSRPFGYTWIRSRVPARGAETAGHSEATGVGAQDEYRYELAQDLRSQLLEEELRNRDRNAALLALDREMQRYRKYLGLTPDEALARAKTASPEEKKLLDRLATDGWGLIQLYFRLSPNDLTALRAGRRLIFRQEPKANQQPLPADLVRGVMQSQRNSRILSREDGFHLGNAKENPDGLLPTAVPEVRAEVTIRMPQSELGLFTLTGGPGLYIAEDRGFDLTGSAGALAVGVSPAVLNPDNGTVNAKLAGDPALRPRVTVRPQPSCSSDLSPGPSPKRGGVPGSRYGTPHPESAQRHEGSGAADKLPLPASGRGSGGEVNPQKVSTADVLEALHRACGLPVVADSYTRLYPLGEVSTHNMTLFEALNRLADAMRLRWAKDGGWLQFRSTSYFNDRLKEVPNRLIGRWAASRRQHGALTLDDLIEIAQLSDAQLDATAMAEGARVCWGLAEWELLSELPYLRPHLRYLAGFTPEQRRMAMSPEGLPFTRMTLAQQQQYLAFLLLPDVDRIHSLEDLAGATLRVGYTLPGEFQWVLPGWRRYLPLVIREHTQEAALQAARRTDPQVTEAQIAPTRLDLAFVYTRTSSPRFRAVCRRADGWSTQ